MENPVLKKLRLKSGQRAAVIGAPESYLSVLAEAPGGVEISDTLDGSFDFVHCFVTNRAELERLAPTLRAAMKPSSILWVSYPKGTAIPTDLKRDVLWEALSPVGLIPCAQVAIDEVWSALRFKLA